MPASKSRCFRLFVEALITIIFFDGLFVTVVGLAIGSHPIIPQLVLYFGLMAGSSAMALVGGIYSAAQGQQDAVYYWQTGLCILRILHFMLGAALLLRIAHEQGTLSSPHAIMPWHYSCRYRAHVRHPCVRCGLRCDPTDRRVCLHCVDACVSVQRCHNGGRREKNTCTSCIVTDDHVIIR